MNTRGIALEDVSAAADRIVARGERPSLRTVRAELGTGSLGTIQRYLAEWRAGRRPIEATGLALPAEIQRVILLEIERHVAAARATLEAELSDAKTDRETLAEEAERLVSALGALEQRGTEQAAEIERQSGAISQLERSLSEARDLLGREREAAESARRASALAELRLESLPHLQAELVELRGKMDDEREARRRAEIEAAELRGQHGKKA